MPRLLVYNVKMETNEFLGHPLTPKTAEQCMHLTKPKDVRSHPPSLVVQSNRNTPNWCCEVHGQYIGPPTIAVLIHYAA